LGLRRMLLAEASALRAGAAIGVIIAQPLVTSWSIRLASPFARWGLTVDFSMLWVGVALAIVAAVILAFVPRPAVG